MFLSIADSPGHLPGFLGVLGSAAEFSHSAGAGLLGGRRITLLDLSSILGVVFGVRLPTQEHRRPRRDT